MAQRGYTEDELTEKVGNIRTLVENLQAVHEMKRLQREETVGRVKADVLTAKRTVYLHLRGGADDTDLPEAYDLLNRALELLDTL